jgi:hypothetical protein
MYNLIIVVIFGIIWHWFDLYKHSMYLSYSFLKDLNLTIFNFLMLGPFKSTTDTVPPKKRILDTSQDFYTSGFVPGANVHFAYDLPEGMHHHND